MELEMRLLLGFSAMLVVISIFILNEAFKGQRDMNKKQMQERVAMSRLNSASGKLQASRLIDDDFAKSFDEYKKECEAILDDIKEECES
jgi:hypothetical protein